MGNQLRLIVTSCCKFIHKAITWSENKFRLLAKVKNQNYISRFLLPCQEGIKGGTRFGVSRQIGRHHMYGNLVKYSFSGNLSIYLPLCSNFHGGHRQAVLGWRKARVVFDNSVRKYSVKPLRPGRWEPTIHTCIFFFFFWFCHQCNLNPYNRGM